MRVSRGIAHGLSTIHFGIFTLRDIEIGEELTYDYGWRVGLPFCNFSDIAPTSNVRTSMRSKRKTEEREEGRGEEGEEEEEEVDVGKDSSGISRRRPLSTRRTAVRTTESVAVSATAPTVQRCYCGSKSCKGFLGSKKLPFSHTSASSSKLLIAPSSLKRKIKS
ncbi:hypothetical protein VP01_1198g3 [Puccinia sorghi]|uniref:Post-SET domain-containing protein n=1 Tax=Puccinia sorghi TaxID=27349 RepID=A0A0L6VS46_9BASI|nr:hypothetical protein VP01_1198g3 [Puccinia sorghi]